LTRPSTGRFSSRGPDLPIRSREVRELRLIACQSCHTQFDAEQIAAARFPCRCGATIENRPSEPKDAAVVRCGSCGAALEAEDGSCSFCGSRLARRPDASGPVCPECFARTPAGSRFCTACGVAFRPEPLSVEAREIPCPACSLPMRPRAVAGIELYECAQCEGLWIPEGCLEPLLRQVRDASGELAGLRASARTPRVRSGNPASQRVEYRRCPECDAHMQRRNFQRASGIIVDLCRRHGTWLDADELEQIAGFVREGSSKGDFASVRGATATPTPAPDVADAVFTRLLAEHRAHERRGPEASPTLFDILFGRLR
jgi:Zn-finger nucleic acid-binding protein